jgi:predicted nucleic acid-binding protein
MKLLISDANILIDMEAGDLIEVMFRLPETFAVPNILYEEELLEHHPELPGYGLQVLGINEQYMQEAYRLRGQYSKPGQNDLFALALAKQEKCPLLTGDKNLRTAAESEEVAVRGTLWLMERLIEERIITITIVERAYDRMKGEGRRLPWKDVNAQIRKFRNQ